MRVHTAAAPFGVLPANMRKIVHKSNHRKVTRKAIHNASVNAVSAPAKTPSSEYTLSNIELWNGTKRLQLQVLDIADDTVCIRCLDWDRDRFDIEFALEIGTTYNAYLIFGEEKTALVDASHEKFRGMFIKQVQKELAKKGRSKIDYIFVSHTEPDHSGLIAPLVEIYPEATVAGSKVSMSFLKGLTRTKFNAQPVKAGDMVDLGGGHVIEFVMAPNLHWPDSMFSLDLATNVMYTCDAFGSHYCTEDPWDSDLQAMLPHFRFYYDCLMKPNARSVIAALNKTEEMEYSTIANGHGPLLRYNMVELVGLYGKWSKSVGKSNSCVAVLYSDNYGYCDRLSQTLAKGVTKANVATEMVDLGSVDHAELRAMVGGASAVIIMCPDHDNTVVQDALSIAITEMSAKKHTALVAESYGGNDEPVDEIVATLVNLGIVTSTLRIKETPTEKVYQQYEEAGTDIAQMLGQKAAIESMKSMDVSVAKALGKLSSGLYVVTAAQNNAKGAMIASWVAQASFEPLGLTVAVAKDRAIESFMQVGDTFVLNALGEGKEKSVLMKHFLKRFPPGADRFEGIETFLASNGAPVLADGIAHLELKVKSRMETEDHWVTYCEVVNGNVTVPDAKTAVHRRKVGNYY